MSKVYNMVGGGGGGIRLASIAVTTPPTKATYTIGDLFDPAGMVVTATYTNGATKRVTEYSYSPATALPVGNAVITISYTENNITKTTTLTVPVTLKIIAAVPSQSGSLTYTGGALTPSWNNYDSAKMTLGGVTSGTNAGSYNATFTPKAGYQWADGTTAAKTVAWSIAKATGSLTISKTAVTLNGDKTSDTITVTRAGDGAITATSSDTAVATVSVSGTTVTISSVNDTTGTATITIKVAAGTNYTAPADKPVSVSAEFKPQLNDLTWAEVAAISAAGQGPNYFAVGDCKAVAVNGTVGTLAVNATYYAYILGFAHNGASNTIDFGTFKTALSGGTDICLTDSEYNSYATDGKKYFNQNHWGDYNHGGWKGCDLRYDILGSTNTAPSGYGGAPASGRVGYDAESTTATSPVANTLMAALPPDLRAVMKPMTIYSDNTGGGTNTAACVTTSVDYLPLLAEFEIYGSRSYANSYEQNYQQQYTYYVNGNSKVKYHHSATGYTARGWERSPYYIKYNGSGFCFVSTDGTESRNSAWYSYGLAPIFRI